jgi:hypothetical protein
MIQKYVQNREIIAWILCSSFRPASSEITGNKKPIIGVRRINGIPIRER